MLHVYVWFNDYVYSEWKKISTDDIKKPSFMCYCPFIVSFFFSPSKTLVNDLCFEFMATEYFFFNLRQRPKQYYPMIVTFLIVK